MISDFRAGLHNAPGLAGLFFFRVLRARLSLSVAVTLSSRRRTLRISLSSRAPWRPAMTLTTAARRPILVAWRPTLVARTVADPSVTSFAVGVVTSSNSPARRLY